MAAVTGDVAGKVALLRRDVQHIKWPSMFDEDRAACGDHHFLLGILSWVLHRFSRHVAAFASGHQVYGGRGRRYVEAVIRFARNQLGLKPVLNASQFLSSVSREAGDPLLRVTVKDHTKAWQFCTLA